MLIKIENLKLIMAEKSDLPERKQGEGGEWEKTGKTIEKTTYTLKDVLSSEKLVFLAGNDYRILEGKDVDIQVDIKFNDFSRKTAIVLKTMTAR